MSRGAVTGFAGIFDTARTTSYTVSGTDSGQGTVTIDPDTGAFTYIPTAAQLEAATASSTDSFTVTGSNGVDTATQTITVKVGLVQ